MTCNNKHFNKKGTNFLLNNMDFKALELKGKINAQHSWKATWRS
jgi:hypothetical protein